MSIDRRTFLKNSSALTLGGLLFSQMGCAGGAKEKTMKPSPVKKNKRIGFQIFSLGNDLYKDLPGGLKQIREMGYQTLELAKYRDGKINGVDMLEFKKMADDAGLKITSSHINPSIQGGQSMNNIEKVREYWKKTVDEHARIGVSYLVQPSKPSTKNVEETKSLAELFNEVGKIVKSGGMSFGFHNHDGEFAKVIPNGNEPKFGRREKGESIYNILLANTDPSLVMFEMDVYWAVMGQADPVAYMTKYPDRIKLLHIKDEAVLGESGLLNFEQIFKHFYANGNLDYYVELEGIKEGLRFKSAKESADYLLNAAFVK